MILNHLNSRDGRCWRFQDREESPKDFERQVAIVQDRCRTLPMLQDLQLLSSFRLPSEGSLSALQDSLLFLRGLDCFRICQDLFDLNLKWIHIQFPKSSERRESNKGDVSFSGIFSYYKDRAADPARIDWV